MERGEYERMHALEGQLWWYRGLHGLVVDQVAAMARATVRPVLDAGCGTGGLLAALARRGACTARLGLEYDADAAALAAEKGRTDIVVGSVTALPFASGTMGGIVSADVLPHRLVDPVQALREAGRCLEDGGFLVLNLPAYQWMFSAHDRHVHSARRFTRRQAIRLVRQAGFDVRRATYWNCILFPLMVLRRMLTRGGAAGSDVRPFPAPVNRLFGAIVGLERRLIGWGLSLPFGGSVLLVARKEATQTP
jgi:SAM-dependent methyltransferase